MSASASSSSFVSSSSEQLFGMLAEQFKHRPSLLLYARLDVSDVARAIAAGPQARGPPSPKLPESPSASEGYEDDDRERESDPDASPPATGPTIASHGKKIAVDVAQGFVYATPCHTCLGFRDDVPCQPHYSRKGKNRPFAGTCWRCFTLKRGCTHKGSNVAVVPLVQ